MHTDHQSLPELRRRAARAREQGHMELALMLLADAVALAPHDPDTLAEAALTHMICGELQTAEDLLREARQQAPEHLELGANLGALLQHRGHLQEAIECYREVLDAATDEVEIRCNLAKALSDCGDTAAALRETETALALAGGARGVLATRGAVFVDAQRYQEARDALLQSLEAEPTNDMTLVNLALCCTELHDHNAATNYLVRAVELNPHNARAVADLANNLCATGDAPQAVQLTRGFLREHPGEPLVVAALAQSLQNSGDDKAANELTDCAALVQVMDLPAPGEFSDHTAFHAELAQEILTDRSLLADPVAKATTAGEQTGELDLRASPAKRAFARTVQTAIRATVADFRARNLGTHPVLQRASDRWSLRAWGTVLRAGGHQAPHMHPLGWLSAVYYVAVPDDMHTGQEEGWLEFGTPPPRICWARPPATRRIEPKPGRLVVFPSWLWHRTLPFAEAVHDPRISIAFDVMPSQVLRQI